MKLTFALFGLPIAGAFMTPTPLSTSPAAGTQLDLYADGMGGYGYSVREDRRYRNGYTTSRGGEMVPATQGTAGSNVGADNWYDDGYNRRDTALSNGMYLLQDRRSVIQGNSRGTVVDPYGDNEQVEVELTTSGRPMDTKFELWEGPNNTPTSVKVFSENGYKTPFRALVNTPRRGISKAMDVQNSGPVEFPVDASVRGATSGSRPYSYGSSTYGGSYTSDDVITGPSTTVQGGSLKTWSFDPYTTQVRVHIVSDGLPTYAQIELWGVSNHDKQVAQVYNDNGHTRPFTAIVDLPGYDSNTICVKNVGPLEYPIEVAVEPYSDGYGFDRRGGYGGRGGGGGAYGYGGGRGGYGRSYYDDDRYYGRSRRDWWE